MQDVSVCQRLKTAREAAGLSLREAAKRMDIAPSTLLHWEDGSYSPRITDVPVICEAIRCKPRWLVFGPQRRGA